MKPAHAGDLQAAAPRSAADRAPPPGSGRRRRGGRRIISPNRVAPAGVQRAERLVQQPQRRAARRAAGPAPAGAAGRPTAAGPPGRAAARAPALGGGRGAWRRSRRSTASRTPVPRAPCGRASARPGGPAVQARGRAPRSASAPAERRSRPPPARTRPATARSRLVLPEPFGPVSAQAWPARKLSERSANSAPPAPADAEPRRSRDAIMTRFRVAGMPNLARAWTVNGLGL